MNKNLSLEFIVYEAKREWKKIVALALLIGILGTFVTVFRTKQQINNATYGAYFSLLCNTGTPNASGCLIDTSERDKAIVLSDAVAEQTSELCPELNLTKAILKGKINIYSGGDGGAITIHVTDTNSATALQICNALEIATLRVFSELNIGTIVLEEAVEEGAISVSKVTDNYTQQTNAIVTSVVLPTINAQYIIKYLVVYIATGLIIGYVLVLLLYCIQNKIRYKEELMELGIQVIYEVKKQDDENNKDELKQQLLLFTEDNDGVLVASYGKPACEITNHIGEVLDDRIQFCTENARGNLGALNKYDCTNVVLYIKAGEVDGHGLTMDTELLKLTDKIFIGVIFEE